MKTIEVKFPTIEGMKVENASVDLKKGASVVEYVEEVKFKKGDIVFHDTVDYVWVFIYSNRDGDAYCGYNCVEVNDGDHYTSYRNNKTNLIRLATDSEKQLLFDALEKEGKYWDVEALEVKEFERVPDDIGIYKCNKLTKYNKGDGLYIGFNDNKQNLSISNGIYTVTLNNDSVCSRIDCYLKPINHEDVKVGDTILCGDKEYLSNYYKIIENGCAYTSDENDVFVLNAFGSQEKLFKLIPIK